MEVVLLVLVCVLLLGSFVMVRDESRRRRQVRAEPSRLFGEVLSHSPVRTGPADPTRRARRVVYCGRCGRPELERAVDRCRTCSDPLEAALWDQSGA